MDTKKQIELEESLDNFNAAVRRSALEELTAAVNSGEMSVPAPKEEVNLHYHTFYSFNAEEWSPTRIAWEAKKYGLEAAGIVDFDVLDGMEEFLSAADLLNLKATAAMETRVFIPELAEHVINSPNEPGIAYFMASGCFKLPEEGTEADKILKRMRQMARERTIAVMDRVNAYLEGIQLDYEKDVVPLTPAGNATERHLLKAYDLKVRSEMACENCVANFWAEKLNLPIDQAKELVSDTPKLHETIRSKLMKLGGPGYVAPDNSTFPTVDEAITMIQGMDAMPMMTWLDGTNPGENDMFAQLSMLEKKGVMSLNIIPDRNWNIKKQEEKAIKVEKLGEVVKAANDLDFPLSVGTEMNKAGLPFVDNFQAPELKPFVADLVRGARALYGHTLLARNADFGYFSKGANEEFGDDRSAKNRFYEKIGVLPNNEAVRQELKSRAGKWTARELENAIVLLRG